jgi:hypothetical protein
MCMSTLNIDLRRSYDLISLCEIAMAKLTLRELMKLGKQRQLRSDLSIWFYDHFGGLSCVRHAERRTERKYPTHRILRHASVKYFSGKGFHIYPNGIGPIGCRTCADLAIIPQNSNYKQHATITFVECLTAHFFDRETIKEKRQLEEFGRLFFVVEYRPKSAFASTRDWQRFKDRAKRLAACNQVYWCRCNENSGRLRKVRAIRPPSPPVS